MRGSLLQSLFAKSCVFFKKIVLAKRCFFIYATLRLKGDRFVSGYGASLLESAGIGDLVAHDPEEFALICAHLAADVEKLRDLRRDLRSMMVENGMSDPIRMARSLEKAYAEMSRIASL